MLKIVAVILVFCLLACSAFCQSTSKYQVASILAVKPHLPAGERVSGTASYDVSVKVGDMVYVVLYTAAANDTTARYVAGRELLVLVGEKTIGYNDILGRSSEVPILSRAPAAKAKVAE